MEQENGIKTSNCLNFWCICLKNTGNCLNCKTFSFEIQRFALFRIPVFSNFAHLYLNIIVHILFIIYKERARTRTREINQLVVYFKQMLVSINQLVKIIKQLLEKIKQKKCFA